jgi:hypothetical protein
MKIILLLLLLLLLLFNKSSCSKTYSPYKSSSMLKTAITLMATHLPKSPRMCCKGVTELDIAHGIPDQNAQNNKQIHHLSPGTDRMTTFRRRFCGTPSVTNPPAR